MYSNKAKSRLSGIFMALSLLLGVGVFSAAGVQAQDVWRQNQQDRDWNRDRANRRDRDDDNDRDDRRGNGRKGRGRYGRYGQSGQAGYGNYGNYGYNVYQQAQQQGYRDGLSTGSSDAQRGQSYNPQRSHYYRNANSGYNSSYGNRGQFQQAYRQGFLQGYQQGFQQYGGYNRNTRRWPW